MTSRYAAPAGFSGNARWRLWSYISRLVVFRRVKGEDGVGAVSSFNVHSGGGGGVDVDAGSESSGPRIRAPPVNGEGLKAADEACCFFKFGGSRDGG